MTFVAGIDMGAKSTKAVILDGEKRICGNAGVKTRPDFARGCQGGAGLSAAAGGAQRD